MPLSHINDRMPVLLQYQTVETNSLIYFHLLGSWNMLQSGCKLQLTDISGVSTGDHFILFHFLSFLNTINMHIKINSIALASHCNVCILSGLPEEMQRQVLYAI